jgi:AcrR family transcriptional regulator
VKSTSRRESTTRRGLRDAGAARGRPGKARELLLAAAIREFAEKGFVGATTAGIARRARTHQPLVHHHFGSKKKLFEEVIDTLFERLRAALFPPGDALSPAILMRRFVETTASQPELMRIWVIECTRQGPHAAYIVEKHIRPLLGLVEPWIAEAVRSEALPAMDPHLLTYALQGLASYPFLVPAQVKRLNGVDATQADFVRAYADLVVAILLRAKP